MTDELLSGRERDVLLALGRGLARKEVATELRIAEGTVHSIVGRIFLKLGVVDRDAAIRRARRLGIM